MLAFLKPNPSTAGRISNWSTNISRQIYTLEERSDFTRFLSETSIRRKPSLVREFAAQLPKANSAAVFMAGGDTNPTSYPFTSITFDLAGGGPQVEINGKELAAALSYQPTLGYPPLRETLKNFQKHFHSPPDWSQKDLIITTGSQQGLSTAIEMIMNIGDPVLIPSPAYSSIFTIMDPHLPKYLAVTGDSQGMIPTSLSKILNDWRCSNALLRKPRLLYLNPTAANPCGTTLSNSRKEEIYQIAKDHDLIILEDDPYYFLSFDDENQEDKAPLSFLSLDSDARVIRFDTFSKILSSGLRIGFATGPANLIRQMELAMQASVLHTAALPQVALDAVLRQWGVDGFMEHIERVKKTYRAQRDLMLAAATKHLTGLAEWHSPSGGMFLWIKVLGVQDTYKMVIQYGCQQGVVLLPGREFFHKQRDPCPYVRASFSVVTPEEMDKGFARLATVILAQQKRQNSNT